MRILSGMLAFYLGTLACAPKRDRSEGLAPESAEQELGENEPLRLTLEDEERPRQFFELLQAGGIARCANGAFVNGLDLPRRLIYCRAGGFQTSQTIQEVARTGERLACPRGSALVGVKADAQLHIEAGICQALSPELARVEGKLIKEGQHCRSQGLAVGFAYQEETANVSKLTCIGLGGEAETWDDSGLQLAASADTLAILGQTEQLEIRAKNFSVGLDYALFVGGRQLALADGSLFSWGVSYKLLDQNAKLLLQGKEEMRDIFFNFHFTRPVEPKAAGYMRAPFELHVGPYIHLFDAQNTKMGAIDRKNFTFLFEYDVLGNDGKVVYSVKQKFHLFRRVFLITRRAPTAIPIEQVALAIIYLDRKAL